MEREMEIEAENTSGSFQCLCFSASTRTSASHLPFSTGLDINSMFQILVAVPLSPTWMVPFFLGLLNWYFIQTLNFIFHTTFIQGHYFHFFQHQAFIPEFNSHSQDLFWITVLAQEKNVYTEEIYSLFGKLLLTTDFLDLLVSSLTDVCEVSPSTHLTYKHTIPSAWNILLPFPPESFKPHTRGTVPICSFSTLFFL